MQFPQELIDIFLDYLSEDTNSLKNCSLVGHSWMLGSRRHLFRRVTLDLSCVFNMPGDLDIAARVEAFTLSASQLSLGDQYAAFDSVLSCIAEALRNVETFTLCDVQWLGGFSRLTSSILSMLALPSIRSVSFRRFTSSVPGLEPSKLLMLAPNLQKLHLEDVRPRLVELLPSPPPNPAAIQSLSLPGHCSLAQFGWMLDVGSPFDLRELRELRLGSWVTRMDTLFVERLLRIAGASLVHLELGQPPCVDHAGSIHVGLVPNLQSISILDAGFDSVIPWMITLLHQSNASSHLLESIRIEFAPSPGDPWPGGSYQWTMLDILFVQPKLQLLKRVHFRFPKNIWDQIGLKQFHDDFPMLTSRGHAFVDIF
ncbi:hypothetical protein BD779DRAFT_1676438 [Infundibulicybe gibba]|nr:hypothetical protein BD779DRAFT_1676438 [Infundibulicybe gibba]